MKSISEIALERLIEELQQQKNIAVRKVAKPYDDKITQVRIDLAKLRGEDITTINSIESTKKPYTGAKRGRKPKISTSLVYPTNGTVLQKLLYVIKEIGRFVTIREIASLVKTYEPNVHEDTVKERFGKHIDKYKRQRKIYTYQVGTKRNTVYGLPEWIKEDKPIEGREHDEDALIDKPMEQQPTIAGLELAAAIATGII